MSPPKTSAIMNRDEITYSFARRVFEELFDRDGLDRLAMIDQRGYWWFIKTMIPCAECLTTRTRTGKERWCASAALGQVGLELDILLHAYRASARAYISALRLDPDYAEDWECLSEMLLWMHRRRHAATAARKALGLQTKASLADMYLEDATELSQAEFRKCYPLSLPGNVNELLAAGKPHDALKYLAGRRSAEAIRLRCLVYGAMNDHEAYERELGRLLRAGHQMDMGFMEWFLIPYKTPRSRRWPWLLLKLQPYPRPFDHPVPEGLEHAIPNPVNDTGQYDYASPEYEQSRYRQWFLYLQFLSADIRDDRRAAKKLARKYPKFTAARELSMRLASKRWRVERKEK